MWTLERAQEVADGISTPELAFREQLADFKARHAALWKGTAAAEPALGERFEPAVQAENEHETDRLVRDIESRLEQYPHSPEDRDSWRSDLRARIRRFGKECFRFPDNYLGILLSDEYLRVTSAFARQAESFNRDLEPEALSQALRNVWVMNCLQMFVGRPVSLSPSIFAYSMLYPYTDNLLDDALVQAEAKREMCRRLGRRLQGTQVEAGSRHEGDVHRLVAMIESEYDRSAFPEVYWILLAIHRAQVRSLGQQGPGCEPDEESILDISLEKGGASVLADGYLVAGRLRRAEAGFFFGFGVVLQLFDDLQDVSQDLEADRRTLFSRIARDHPLDGVVCRLYGFLLKVLRSAPRFPSSCQRVLEDLIRTNCGFLLLQAVSQNQDLFGADFLRRIEPYSPVRFEYLKALRGVIAEKQERLQETVLKRRGLASFYHLLA